MTEPFHPLTDLCRSFYSADFYRGAARRRGRTFVYLGVVLALCWLPILIQVQAQLSRYLAKAEQRLPDIRFANGTITTTENKPYVFLIGDGVRSTGFIIDTSGRYTSLSGERAQVLVTGHQFFLRQATGEVRVYDLSASRAKPLLLDHAYFHRVLKMIRVVGSPLFLVGIYILSYFKRLVQAFLIAILGLGVSALLEVELDLGELLNLAIVAMTPAMILETWIALAGKQFPMEWVFAGGLILAYFIFAINAASGPPEA